VINTPESFDRCFAYTSICLVLMIIVCCPACEAGQREQGDARQHCRDYGPCPHPRHPRTSRMKNIMEHTNAHFIHCNLPSMGCEMDYVDSDNIPVAPSCTYNVVDVNIVARLFL
jgi:hypothetical protein